MAMLFKTSVMAELGTFQLQHGPSQHDRASEMVDGSAVRGGVRTSAAR